MSDAAAPCIPCNVSNPDVVSECGKAQLPTAIHYDDKIDHDTSFVQTCLEEVESADYATPHKPIIAMRGEDPLNENLDPRSRLHECGL